MTEYKSRGYAMAKLSEKEVLNLCEDYKAGATIRALVDKYGISYLQIWRILDGQAWRKVTEGESILRGKTGPMPPEQIRQIRREYADGETQTVIAARHGITQSMVSAIISRKTYRKVE